MSCTQRDRDKIAVLAAQIDNYETAITAILTGSVQEYSFNTGQTIQRVTKLNIQQVQNLHAVLCARLEALELKCGIRTNTRHMIPGF